MPSSATESLPIEVGQLGNFEARMLRNIHAAVEDWDEVCSALGAWEQQHLTADEPRAALGLHKGWLNELLAWGQLFQQATRQPQFPDKTLAGLVDSRMRHLEDKLAIWHADMSREQEDRILKAAFE